MDIPLDEESLYRIYDAGNKQHRRPVFASGGSGLRRRARRTAPSGGGVTLGKISSSTKRRPSTPRATSNRRPSSNQRPSSSGVTIRASGAGNNAAAFKAAANKAAANKAAANKAAANKAAANKAAAEKAAAEKAAAEKAAAEKAAAEKAAANKAAANKVAANKAAANKAAADLVGAVVGAAANKAAANKAAANSAAAEKAAADLVGAVVGAAANKAAANKAAANKAAANKAAANKNKLEREETLMKKIQATQIQATQRGMKARKNFAKKAKAIKTLQSVSRGRKGRKIVTQKKANAEAAAERQNTAIKTLQSMSRGRKGRELVTKMKANAANRATAAAAENVAVTKLQSAQRGKRVRKNLAAKEANRAADEEGANLVSRVLKHSILEFQHAMATEKKKKKKKKKKQKEEKEQAESEAVYGIMDYLIQRVMNMNKEEKIRAKVEEAKAKAEAEAVAENAAAIVAAANVEKSSVVSAKARSKDKKDKKDKKGDINKTLSVLRQKREKEAAAKKAVAKKAVANKAAAKKAVVEAAKNVVNRAKTNTVESLIQGALGEVVEERRAAANRAAASNLNEFRNFALKIDTQEEQLRVNLRQMLAAKNKMNAIQDPTRKRQIFENIKPLIEKIKDVWNAYIVDKKQFHKKFTAITDRQPPVSIDVDGTIINQSSISTLDEYYRKLQKELGITRVAWGDADRTVENIQKQRSLNTFKEQQAKVKEQKANTMRDKKVVERTFRALANYMKALEDNKLPKKKKEMVENTMNQDIKKYQENLRHKEIEILRHAAEISRLQSRLQYLKQNERRDLQYEINHMQNTLNKYKSERRTIQKKISGI